MIEGSIATRYYFTAGQALDAMGYQKVGPVDVMGITVLVMKNGFIVIGKSAPASPENFNEQLSRNFSYEDAIRQLWPLMAYELRSQLYGPVPVPAQETP